MFVFLCVVLPYFIYRHSYFILSLLFIILTMDTLSEINLMDGWMDGWMDVVCLYHCMYCYVCYMFIKDQSIDQS